MKRLAILGRGTVGAINAAFCSREIEKLSNSSEHEIVWIYDPAIPTQSVGEGVALPVMEFLKHSLEFTHHDMRHIDAHFKTGIFKDNWGLNNKSFVHNFYLPHTAYHFNATKVQDYILEYLKQKSKIKIIENNITSDKIDADHIIDCSGRPNNFDEDFVMATDIPVNSVYVTQCFWEFPRFTHSLTNAAKHGWYFGIPLQNRCSIGYLYNNKINTLDEIKEDVQSIFNEYNLVPSDKTNAFSFNNYYRKDVITPNISYNGNACFFLEPLEATSLTTALFISSRSMLKYLGLTNKTYLQLNNEVDNLMQETIDMIMLHYFSGSKYNTKFWEMAKQNGEKRIQNSIIKNKNFKNLLLRVINSDFNSLLLLNDKSSYGTWANYSWKENINGLGIYDKLVKML